MVKVVEPNERNGLQRSERTNERDTSDSNGGIQSSLSFVLKLARQAAFPLPNPEVTGGGHKTEKFVFEGRARMVVAVEVEGEQTFQSENPIQSPRRHD